MAGGEGETRGGLKGIVEKKKKALRHVAEEEGGGFYTMGCIPAENSWRLQ